MSHRTYSLQLVTKDAAAARVAILRPSIVGEGGKEFVNRVS